MATVLSFSATGMFLRPWKIGGAVCKLELIITSMMSVCVKRVARSPKLNVNLWRGPHLQVLGSKNITQYFPRHEWLGDREIGAMPCKSPSFDCQ